MSIARIISILLYIFVITTVLVSPVAAAAPEGYFSGTETLSIDTAGGEAVTQTSDTGSSGILNTSSRHIGPEIARDEPSAEIVISEVEARIGSQLLNSSDSIQAGQFDTAEATLSGNTTDLINQYERVADQTESTADDEIARVFNESVQRQRKLVNTAQNSSVIYNEYQLARANGNQTRARQLARQLLKQTRDGNRTAEKLLAQYEKLANETELNATQPIAGINDAQTRLAEIRDTVRSETLTPTSLRVSASAVGSPTQPIEISGQLTSNNSQLANKTINISVGDRTARTKTSETGAFSASIRPITLASGQQTVSVRFTPEQASIYDDQRVEKSVRIDSVAPDVDIQYSTAHVRFNETVAIDGEVAAGEIPLPDVPVTTTIGGQQFSSTRTGAEGDFRIRNSLPATIPNGSHQLEVIISNQNTAVQQVTTTERIDINSTETELSFTSIRANGSNIEFSGRLTTANGTELPNRNIVISQGASSSVASSTNQSGYFDGSISMQSTNSVSQLVFGSDERTLTARYDSAGGNLEPSTQDTIVSYTPPISVPLQQIVLVGFSVAGILYGVVRWRRRETRSNESEDALQEIADSETTLRSNSTPPVAPERLLSHAETYHDEGNMEAATRLGYAALRQKYMEAYDVTESLTHWELYRTLKSDLNSSTQELFYEVTAVYEQELYSNVDLGSNDDFGGVLEQLREVIETDDGRV